MKSVLESLLKRHGNTLTDWMGFTINKKNPYTYHHIQKSCDRGKKTIENGAVLGRQSHRFLHFIEKKNPDLYEEWNDLFREINQSEDVLKEEHYDKIKVLRQRGYDIENHYMKRKK